MNPAPILKLLLKRCKNKYISIYILILIYAEDKRLLLWADNSLLIRNLIFDNYQNFKNFIIKYSYSPLRNARDFGLSVYNYNSFDAEFSFNVVDISVMYMCMVGYPFKVKRAAYYFCNNPFVIKNADRITYNRLIANLEVINNSQILYCFPKKLSWEFVKYMFEILSENKNKYMIKIAFKRFRIEKLTKYVFMCAAEIGTLKYIIGGIDVQRDHKYFYLLNPKTFNQLNRYHYLSIDVIIRILNDAVDHGRIFFANFISFEI